MRNYISALLLLVLSCGYVAAQANAPLLLTQPESRTVDAGYGSVSFQVKVGGYPLFHYFWRKDGEFFSTANTLTFRPVALSNAGIYDVIVSNMYGCVTSAPAVLTVNAQGPGIYQEPEDEFGCSGSQKTFSTVFGGTPPLYYQWQRNGTGYGPSDRTVYPSIAIDLQVPAYPTNAGAYTLVVSNAYGSATSRVARLSVDPGLPVIDCQPQSGLYAPGSSFSIACSAFSCSPMTYQWRSNGVALAGATNDWLNLYTSLDQTAAYDVTIGNAAGAVTSRVAFILVTNLAPEITCQPQSQAIFAGQNLSLSVWTHAAPPPSYQWLRNGLPIPGATASTYYSSSVPTNASGAYQVIVSNAAGVVTSAVATVTVTFAAPVITIPPQSVTVDYGRSVSFSVTAAGSPYFFYQWRFNGQDILGATTNTLCLSSVYPTNAGDYTVVVSNAVGAVTSQVATLTVLTSPPVFTNQPQSQVVYEDDTVRFHAGAFGAPAPTYQWQHNGTNIAGATSPDYTHYYVRIVEAGNYTVVASNRFGVVTSEVAVLTVQLRPPFITFQPLSQTVYAGSNTGFSINSDGSRPLSYQWQRDGQNLPRATNSYLSLPNVSSNDEGSYRAVVSNAAGTAISSNAILTVRYSAPTFTTQPQSKSLLAESVTTLDSLAVGGPFPVYQWYFRNQPIANATNPSVQLYVSSTNQTGDYYVVARNALGTTTSQVARVTVQVTLPFFSTGPVSQGAVLGEAVGFDAPAGGGRPYPVYQWRFNGQDIPGATHYYFNLDSVEAAHAGNYTVVARNEAGSATSQVAVLSVLLPGPLDRWEWRQPRPQGNDLWSVAYGNGRFVALGDGGAKLTSSDGGLTWAYASDGVAQGGRVAWGNGLFMAVRYDYDYHGTRICTLQTSTDGMHWTKLSPDTYGALPLTDITFGGGRFVASDTTGRVIASTNGLTWTAPVRIAPSSLVRLAYLNGLFFAMLPQTNIWGGLAVSPDGLTWTNQGINVIGYPKDITFGNGQYVLAGWSLSGQGAAWTSPDGLSWTAHPMPGITNSLDRIAYGAGTFVAMGESAWCALLSSRDGVSWTLRSTTPTNKLYDVTFGGGRFVAVGNYGNIFVSTNGEIWTTASGGTDRNLRSVARGPDLYVAVGNEGLLFTSPDGAAWTRRLAPTTNNLRGVTFGNGRFVAVGEADALSATVLASSDGIAWTRQPVNTSFGLYSVTFSEGRFVAVGDNGVIFHSPDGLTWTNSSSPITSRLNSIAKGPGMLAAVGRYGAIVTSTNGIDWRNVSPPTTGGYFQGVAYGNGVFVAAGKGGLLYTSTNGVNWIQQASPFASPYWGWTDIEDLSFANGVFIAVSGGGRIATSEDGLLWTWHHSGCHNDLRGILYAGSRFMAVGNNETILQSDFFGPPILHCRGYGTEGFEFLVEGEVGRTYKLQASTDLVTWTDLFTFTSQQGRTVFLDGEAGVYSRQFYRVVSP